MSSTTNQRFRGKALPLVLLGLLVTIVLAGPIRISGRYSPKSNPDLSWATKLPTKSSPELRAIWAEADAIGRRAETTGDYRELRSYLDSAVAKWTVFPDDRKTWFRAALAELQMTWAGRLGGLEPNANDHLHRRFVDSWPHGWDQESVALGYVLLVDYWWFTDPAPQWLPVARELEKREPFARLVRFARLKHHQMGPEMRPYWKEGLAVALEVAKTPSKSPKVNGHLAVVFASEYGYSRDRKMIDRVLHHLRLVDEYSIPDKRTDERRRYMREYFEKERAKGN